MRYIKVIILTFVGMLIKPLMVFSSSGIFIIIYYINSKLKVPESFIFDRYIDTLVAFLILFALTLITVGLIRFLPRCAMESGIADIRLANHEFLPNYLGYCFVALSVGSDYVFVIVYILIFCFLWKSSALAFNPILLLFGYSFYFVRSTDGVMVFLITKRDMKAGRDVELQKLIRINNFTFLDLEKK